MAFIQMALQSQALLRTINVNVILPCDKVTFPGMPAVDSRPFKTLYLLPKTRRLKEVFTKLGYDMTYRETAGGHQWEFWDLHIKAFLDSLPLQGSAGLNSGNVGL